MNMVRRAGCKPPPSRCDFYPPRDGCAGLATVGRGRHHEALLISPQGAAFSIPWPLRGIQEHAYETGFGGGGYPT